MRPQPEKTALVAETDQSFAWAKEMRDGLDGRASGPFIREMGSRVAAQIKAEFPDVNAGRPVMALAAAIVALADALPEMGVTPSLDVLMCIISLAALELDECEET